MPPTARRTVADDTPALHSDQTHALPPYDPLPEPDWHQLTAFLRKWVSTIN